MLPIQLILFLTIMVSNLTQAMDLVPPADAKQKKSSSLPSLFSGFKPTRPTKKTRPKSMSLSSMDELRIEKKSPLAPINELPTKLVPIKEQPDKKEHGLIRAAHNNDLPTIKGFLSNRHLNPNNILEIKTRNTPLHCAAIHKHIDAINLLFMDSRVDASTTNNEYKTARELITFDMQDLTSPATLASIALRHKFFGRASLDFFTTKEALAIEPMYSNGDMTPELFNMAIESIKTRISIVKDSQQQELPKDATDLPPYADDDFILNMLLFRLALPKK
jgi:hypothetical protein